MENQDNSPKSLEEVKEREIARQKALQMAKEKAEERKKNEKEQERRETKKFDWCFSNISKIIQHQREILDLQRKLEKKQAMMLAKANEKIDKCLKNLEIFNKNQENIQQTTLALMENHKALSQMQHDIFKREVGWYERLKLIEQYVITHIASSE